MTNKPQKTNIVQLNAIPKKLIRLFSKAIAKLLLKFNISKHDYNHFLNEQLVLEAKKQNPKASKVELSVRTGIDRRFIGDYLKGDMPTIKSSKLSLILSDVKWTVNKHYKGSNKLPKKGPFKSFESICEQWSSGTLTYKAILTELVRIGSVVDHGDEVELVEAKIDSIKESIQFFELSTDLVNRVTNTIIHNTSKHVVEEQNFQMSAISTQIPPENMKAIKKEVKDELRKYFNNTIELLEKYEVNVKPDSYPAFGVTFLEFNDNNENEV